MNVPDLKTTYTLSDAARILKASSAAIFWALAQCPDLRAHPADLTLDDISRLGEVLKVQAARKAGR